jgi:hypothetical protein
LIGIYRDTHAVCAKFHEQLKPLVAEADLAALPDLDTAVIESVENPGVKDKDKDNKDDKGKKGKSGK